MKVNSQSGSTQVQSAEVSSTAQAKKAAQAQKTKESTATDKAGSVAAKGAAEPSARAEISARAREMSQAKVIAENTPDVREEKIAALKKRIAEGTYKVDADAVADRMVKEHAATAAALA